MVVLLDLFESRLRVVFGMSQAYNSWGWSSLEPPSSSPILPPFGLVQYFAIAASPQCTAKNASPHETGPTKRVCCCIETSSEPHSPSITNQCAESYYQNQVIAILFHGELGKVLHGLLYDCHDRLIRYTPLMMSGQWRAAFLDQGKMVEAEEMYVRALRGYQKTVGNDHPTTQKIARNLQALRARK
jgi:hypothetical protein